MPLPFHSHWVPTWQRAIRSSLMLCLFGALAGFALSAQAQSRQGKRVTPPGMQTQSAPPRPLAQALVRVHRDTRTPGAEAVMQALALLGIPYQWGGSTPESGLDCSGLVKHVYAQLGVEMPRHTSLQSRSGQSVDRSALRPGDLVFFNTRRRAFSHVGIYVGNDRFVHAPSSGAHVRVESLQVGYWRRRYDGARRIVMPSATQLASNATTAVEVQPIAQASLAVMPTFTPDASSCCTSTRSRLQPTSSGTPPLPSPSSPAVGDDSYYRY